MNLNEPNPADYVNPPASDDDVERQWGRIAVRLQRPTVGGRRLLPAAAVLGLLGAGAGLLLVARARPDVPASRPAITAAAAPAPQATQATHATIEGTRVENGQPTARDLDLADGSHVALAPSSAIVLERNRADDMHVIVERGDATFDVTHAPGRRFVVTAAEVDVVVVGTRFVVSVADGPKGRTAAVSVQRGAVEVRRPAARALVRAGESWSGAVTDPGTLGGFPDPPAKDSARAKPELRPRDSAPSPPLSTAPPEDARSLLAVATQARLQGRQREAAAALDRLYRRFPDDARAPLAAFELGRIQLDSLHDATRAAASFRAAMSLARDPVLREDAAARHAEALDASGDVTACKAARQAYLNAYPTGPHVGRVSAYCRTR